MGPKCPPHHPHRLREAWKTKKKQRIAVFGALTSTKHCYTLVFFCFFGWGSHQTLLYVVFFFFGFSGFPKCPPHYPTASGKLGKPKKPTYSSVWCSDVHQTLLYVGFFGFFWLG